MCKALRFFHSVMTVWHKASAVRNCLLSGHWFPLSLSTRAGADINRPPQEKGFQLKSMGCPKAGKEVEYKMISFQTYTEGSLGNTLE